jgi:RsiW-degrading membrane proteinase PrsW (M82 family)
MDWDWAGLAAAIVLSVVPALLYVYILVWIDRFEREPTSLIVASFLWGAIVATSGALVGTLVLQLGVSAFTGDEEMAEVTGTILFAPVCEELTKGAAVLGVYLFRRREFDSVLDGIVYAGVTALGFAASENVLYLYLRGYQAEGAGSLAVLFVLRVLLGGWAHPTYTACFGAGLAIARLSRPVLVRVAAPICGLGVGITLHALHNAMGLILVERVGLGGLLAMLIVDWTQWLAMGILILWALFRQRRWLRTYLREEVDLGTLTMSQYLTACSLRMLFRARRAGAAARAFYQACAELALRKHQFATLGDEGGNAAEILALREWIRESNRKPA